MNTVFVVDFNRASSNHRGLEFTSKFCWQSIALAHYLQAITTVDTQGSGQTADDSNQISKLFAGAAGEIVNRKQIESHSANSDFVAPL